MKIIIGSDHAGFELKKALIPFLKELGHEVHDSGPEKYVEGDDYPDYIAPVAQEVSKHAETVKGIVIGASGQGEAIVANKFPHIRAAVYYGYGIEVADAQKANLEALSAMKIIELSRLHNDANILSLGAKFVTESEAKAAVKLWLETPFSAEDRHVRRIEKIEHLKIHG